MEATVFEGNDASEKILTKAGFHLESHNPFNVYKRGVLKSTKKYVIISERNAQKLMAASTSTSS
jgi:RimJ/RimL family protein N-acetyltransferase